MAHLPKNWTRDFFISNERECKEILENAETLSTIQSLDSNSLDSFTDGQLVRFRGMIQDMHNPDIFSKSYKFKNIKTNESGFKSGLYVDVIKCEPDEEIDVDAPENDNSERQNIFMISVPGLNAWAKEPSNVETKPTEVETPKPGTTEKRTFTEMEVEESDTLSKKGKFSNEKTENTNLFVSKEHLLNFPISNDGGNACIVKIYDNATQCKLNEVLDIVGFLSLDPTLGLISDSNELCGDMEIQTHHPPASIVPRLHAIKVAKVSKPTISQDLEFASKIECIRSDLHKVLSQLLFGDALVADFLICHLLSSVYKRAECLPLGSFPVNIMHIPVDKNEEFAKEMYSVLESLLPKSYHLQCSLENLNELSFSPKKDYECNRLTSGVLQLSDNTHLVIDETKLDAGRLSATGTKNYNAICDIVNFQNLKYDFQFYQVDYETDIPVLIFSNGASFIKSPITVPIQQDNETHKIYSQTVEAVKIYLKDTEKLNNIRRYLISQRYAEFHIDDECVKTIQEDFVNLRKIDQSITTDDFHRLMVFARLMSLSHGLNGLDNNMWRRVVEMDAERKRRIPKKK